MSVWAAGGDGTPQPQPARSRARIGSGATPSVSAAATAGAAAAGRRAGRGRGRAAAAAAAAAQRPAEGGWGERPPPAGALQLQFEVDKHAATLAVHVQQARGLAEAALPPLSNLHVRVHIHPNGSHGRDAAGAGAAPGAADEAPPAVVRALLEQRNHVAHQFKRITAVQQPDL